VNVPLIIPAVKLQLAEGSGNPALVTFTRIQKGLKKGKLLLFKTEPVTFTRSTELIKLTKTNFGDRFVIIGCGGIFSPEDAKEKLEAGASLLQLITGMIFEGPQLVADINSSLDPV
jgi:tRNA-dihydrouridine synthase